MSLVEDVHWQVLTHFRYQPDREQFQMSEHWIDHADTVFAGDVFTGDCDDFALTCAMLLQRAGLPADAIRIATCLTETGGGHLVCLYDHATRGTLMLDNRQRRVIPADAADYTWQKSMRLSTPGVWQTIV